MILVKGTMTVGLLGKIISSILICVLIIYLFTTFFPEIFGGDFCRSKQAENTNKLISEAYGAKSTGTPSYTVLGCLEYIDFSSGIYCRYQVEKLNEGDGQTHRCYEVLGVGQKDGNCVDDQSSADEKADIDGVFITDKDGTQQKFACQQHRGILRPFPGGPNTFEVISEIDDGKGGNLYRLTPGRYVVQTGPYSIKFLDR